MLLHNCVLQLGVKAGAWVGRDWLHISSRNPNGCCNSHMKKTSAHQQSCSISDMRARKHQQALNRGCSCLNPHVKPHCLATLASPSLQLTLCTQQHPLVCKSIQYSKRIFFPLAGCTAHISFYPSCKHTQLPASSPVSLTSLSSCSVQWPPTCYILAFSSQGQGKAIFHPLPLLVLSGANPVPSARNGFVPFFNLWEAVNQSAFLSELHTYAAPCLPQMSCKLSHTGFIHADGLASGFLWRESGFALRWSVPAIRFLWRPWL